MFFSTAVTNTVTDTDTVLLDLCYDLIGSDYSLASAIRLAVLFIQLLNEVINYYLISIIQDRQVPAITNLFSNYSRRCALPE
jgi:hypothetical protein